MTSDPKRIAAERGRFLDAMMRDASLTPSQRLIGYHLLAHANRSSGGAWPSIDTLARLSGLQRRATQQALRALVSGQWFTETAGGGRHRPNTYHPNFNNVQSTAPFRTEEDSETVHENARYDSETVHQTASIPDETVQSDARKGAVYDTKGCILVRERVQQNAPDLVEEPFNEPVEEPVDTNQPVQQQLPELGDVSTRRGSRLPADWVLPEAWAHEGAQVRKRAGMAVIDLSYEADRFRDYWSAQPGAKGLKSDWRATWRNWCRSARAPGSSSPTARSGRGDVAATARRFAQHLDELEAQ